MIGLRRLEPQHPASKLAPQGVPVPNGDVLTQYDVALRPDPSRTVLKDFDPIDFANADNPRTARIVERVIALDEAEAKRLLTVLTEGLGERHRDLIAVLDARFVAVGAACRGHAVSKAKARLIGASFIEEYSFESAALFNPSIVPLPDQDDDASIRFALSLRGVGEGHLSSVTFRTGRWTPGAAPKIDPPSAHAATPVIKSGAADDDVAVVQLSWDAIETPSEAVLFPVLARHCRGIEDARFVRFVEDDGEVCYYATVTAVGDTTTSGELIRARDLSDFSLHPLSGRAAGNKGMALFPRRVAGRYLMIGRQDNENLWLSRSDNLLVWDSAERLLCPENYWEFVQIGNCGSPIEIDEGWLLLTHGVGMARAYSIGACLLDKDDPSKVLARTALPLLQPSREEHDGYVPNVVYSCGALVHQRTLLLPYAIADSFTRFASGSVDAILAAMQ